MAEFLVLRHTGRDFAGGLRGEAFRRLMELCFRHADSFSVSKMTVVPSYPNAVEDLLAPYLVKSEKRTTWFAYFGADPLVETIYNATPQTLEILTRCYQDVFLEKRGRVPKKKFEQIGHIFFYQSVLEDLCFFRGKQMIFGTLSHEKICMARCISQEFEDGLCALARWEETDRDWHNLNFSPF